MGEVVSIAARMEQAAQPGHALISPDTRRLAGSAIQVRSLGPQPVKGVPHPMELFELVGVSSDPRHGRSSPLDAGRFVGREAELTTLTQAFLALSRGLAASSLSAARQEQESHASSRSSYVVASMRDQTSSTAIRNLSVSVAIN